MTRYFVDLDLWPEDKEGDPIFLHGPAASYRGMIDVDGSDSILTYSPEEVACMLAENAARWAAGERYHQTWGIATVNSVRPESEAERLVRLGCIPLFYSYRMPPPPRDTYHVAYIFGLTAEVESPFEVERGL